jgi:hypothetical protein
MISQVVRVEESGLSPSGMGESYRVRMTVRDD